jgi:hypothetical protein
MKRLLLIAATSVAVACGVASAAPPTADVRFATFNASLNRPSAGLLATHLDSAPGNLHADYVLPRKTLQLVDSGVFWPLRADPLFRLTGVFDTTFKLWNLVGGFPTSDHRSVWVDVTVPSVK